MKKSLMLPALFLALSVSAESTVKLFPYQKTATTAPGSAVSDLSVIRCDSDIYAATANLQKDLRIFSEDEREIPFALRRLTRGKKQVVHNLYPATVKSLKKINNALVLIMIPADGYTGYVNGIQVDSMTRNFEKGVTVEGSNDGRKWTRLSDNRPICDYSDYIPYRIDRIFFTPSTYKVYRIIISNITEDRQTPFYAMIKETSRGGDSKEIIKTIREQANFKIDKIAFVVSRLETASNLPITTTYPLELKSVTPKDKNSEMIAGSRSEPITTIKLITSSTNFVRTINIEVPAGQPDQWRQVASGRIYSFDFPSFKNRSLAIDLSEERSSVYRVTVINGDNPPLDNLRLEAYGPVYHLVMTGRQADSLKVLYGAEAPMPQYDTAEMIAKLANPSETVYDLGPQTPNPEFRKSLFSGKNLKLIFAVLTLVAVAVLGVILFKFVRKNDAPGDGE